jgi:hypothetical protein
MRRQERATRYTSIIRISLWTSPDMKNASDDQLVVLHPVNNDVLANPERACFQAE